MKKNMILACLFLVCFLLLININTAWADITVSNNISTNTTWRSYDVDGVITITADISVINGATLTIEPGAYIEFKNGARLTVGPSYTTQGALIANGTVDEPIIFTTENLEVSPGDWDGIYFDDKTNDATSVVSNAFIEGGNFGFYISNASPQIVDNGIFTCYMDGIFANNSSSNLTENYISDTGYRGIAVSNYSGNITGNYIEFTGAVANYPAIQTQSISSPMKISGNYIDYNYHGILLGITTNCLVENNIVTNNEHTGVYVVNNSDVKIINNTVDNNANGILVYNQSGSPSIASVRNNIVSNNTNTGLVLTSAPSLMVTSSNCVYGNGTNHSNVSVGTDIIGDPKFFSIYSYDLRYDSPCIDSGSSTDAPSVDYWDNARPVDGDLNTVADYDIGATEFNLRPRSYIPNITKKYVGWNTPFVSQNLSDDLGYLQYYFYDGIGDETYTYDDIVFPGASSKMNPNAFPDFPTGFRGSAVVWSDQSIGSIVNEHSSKCSMAYEGIIGQKSGQNIYLPNINRSYYGWTTPFIVQNLGTDDATLTIQFFRQGETAPTLEETITDLAPGSSAAINPAKKSSLGIYKGSVVVKGTQDIAAIVNEHNGTTQAMSYNGFDSGLTTVYIPNITRNYYGWNTPFVIQNIGTSETSVTVNFYQSGSGSLVHIENINDLSAGSSVGINPKNLPLGNFKGSVVAISTSEPIVAICNEHSSVDSMSYSGISQGFDENYLPNITKNYFGWTTPFVVQNLDSTSALVDIKFYDANGTLKQTLAGQSIPVNSSKGYNPANYSDLGKSFQGSVIVTSTNLKKVSSIVNEHHSSGQAMSYNGF